VNGKSHLMDFKAGEVAMGEANSELALTSPGRIRLTANVAARLPERPDDKVRRRPPGAQPYWDLERARLGDSRTVPVEVVLNGQPVARTVIVADGQLQPVNFESNT
jgi:hypothetical protein